MSDGVVNAGEDVHAAPIQVQQQLHIAHSMPLQGNI